MKHYLISLLFVMVGADLHPRSIHRLGSPSFKLALNTTEQFGKTHFILGMPEHETQKHAQSAPVQSAPRAQAQNVFFGPDDKLQSKLLNLIKEEKKSIKVAVFMFTDVQIARHLLDAQRRGVKIELVTDPVCIRDKYNKISMLLEQDVPIYVYDTKHKGKGFLSTLMHNKFVVFEQNKNNKSIVWSGSFNFTKSANLRNQETVVILDDRNAVEKFTEQFKVLKTRCVCCKNSLQLAKMMLR